MADRGSKILGVDLPHGREGEGIFALNDNAGNQNRRENSAAGRFPIVGALFRPRRGLSLVGNRKSAACEGGVISQRPSAQYQRGVL